MYSINIYIILLIMSSIMIISSSSWWVLWISLEMTSFFFIPWLMEQGMALKSKTFNYFVVQSMSSFMFISACLLFQTTNSSMLVVLSMLIKLGVYPFSSWMFEVGENLPWLIFFFFSSVMKIGPLFVISVFLPSSLWFTSMMIYLILCSLSGFTLQSVRSIIIYSSVVHLSLMVVSANLSKPLTVYYFFLYSFMLVSLAFLLGKENVSSLKDMTKLVLGSSKFTIIILLISLFSFLGIPPFLGFSIKLILAKNLVFQGMLIESLILLMISIIPVYLYMKMLFFSLFLFKEDNHSFHITKLNPMNWLSCLCLIFLSLITLLW